MKMNKTQHKSAFDDSTGKGLNKMKMIKGHQSVPRLNLDHAEHNSSKSDQNAFSNENIFNDVIKETN